MKVRLLEACSHTVVTLQDMKHFARITDNDDDYLLEGLIKTATAWVEDATGKTLLKKK